MVFGFFVPCCDVRYDLNEKDIWFVFTPICYVAGTCFIYACLYLFLYWCLTRRPCQMMFMSLGCTTTGVTYGTEAEYPSEIPEYIPGCSIFIFFIGSVLYMFVCRLTFFVWLLCCCPSSINRFWFKLFLHCEQIWKSNRMRNNGKLPMNKILLLLFQYARDW